LSPLQRRSAFLPLFCPCLLWSPLFASDSLQITIPLTKEEASDTLEGYPKFDPKKLENETKVVHLWDPSTMDYFGTKPVMTADEVKEIVRRGKVAQLQWKDSSFATRRLLMRTMLRYITENQETCARVAVRDSGKTLLDAIIGEVLVTCEKLVWLADSGEQYLQPEYRATGRMMMMKRVHVEYRPLGVIGAIVPWNYPFHNVFNPVSAALFSGNAIVLKVSEYASWSIGLYKRIIDACLDAVGAPRDLVQFVIGYGQTGDALVRSGVDKVIFVGSPGVGVIVARSAAENLTPVVLELGGKDPFVVCDDADIKSIVQTACRGVWQNMGQNCAGPERFFVYEKVYDEFCDGVASVVSKMKTGVSLGDAFVDCGAICMGTRQMGHYQKLVDDAVKKGARVLAGGFIPSGDDALARGSFYPPTVLADVPENALIAQEEIFGPIMCIFKVKGNSDDEAVRMANNCDFALSSCAFSGSAKRAKSVADRLVAGMSAVNDLEGCTYMSQSLPFGGRNKSGYDR
jgi:acyl-CoA reductase-like NAD-dependent aldehyde dehydrogenase